MARWAVSPTICRRWRERRPSTRTPRSSSHSGDRSSKAAIRTSIRSISGDSQMAPSPCWPEIGLGISRGRRAKLRQRPARTQTHRRRLPRRPALQLRHHRKPPASRMCHPLAPRTPRRAAVAPISWPGPSSASRCRMPTSLYCGTAGHDAGEDLLPDSRIGAHRLAERMQHAPAISPTSDAASPPNAASRIQAGGGTIARAALTTPFGPRPTSSSPRRNSRRAGEVSWRSMSW